MSIREKPDDVGYTEERGDGARLHPMTLLQRFIMSLPGFVILLLPVLRSPTTTSWVNLGFAIFYGALTLPLILLQYLRFRYWITPSEVIIHSGVFTRRRRNIPIERIQNIEVEQKLLPRLLGMARVKVVTAGSDKAEGVLEYVSISEAARIRKAIRTLQHAAATTSLSEATPVPTATAVTRQADEGHGEELIRLDIGRVLLSGAFRFSLLYIALIFSALQFFEPDPEVLVDFLTGGRFDEWAAAISQSPWLAAITGIVSAAVLSWISGILVNLNRYYGFRLSLDGDKLHKRHGLLTLSEGTVPLRKVQALIYRTNPVMRRFGWWALELQTMGLDVREHGHQVAVPFATFGETQDISNIVYDMRWPDRFTRVSKLTIRRMSIRYSVLLAIAAGITGIWWSGAVWAFVLVPLIVVWSYLQYTHHGYALTDNAVVIRRGVVRHQVWYIPYTKFHVFYSTQSIFQRRLGLKSVYVDTAGASSIAYPVVVDVPEEDADAVIRSLYDRFQRLVEAEIAVASLAFRRLNEGNTIPGTEQPESSSSWQGPGGR